jgi:phage terminase large subunit GpA-like protein
LSALPVIAPLSEADEVARSIVALVRPARRIKPSEAVDGKLQNDRGALDLSVTPYLVEPLDMLGSRLYQGVVFVGPARTGKTFGLGIAGIQYCVTIAPADILAIYMSQDTARDFSRLELDRAIANTPELAALLSPRARDDNTYDKFFRNGIALKIGWPAATQLRGKTVRYVFLMDIDGARQTADVDHRGSLWSQAFKRIETYLSRGKCLAESSPGFEYDDPDWKPRTAHEAPPALGIASLYNSGTRARYYFACQHCAQHFQAQPGLTPFAIPTFDEVKEAVQKHDLMTLAESWARVGCPHCGALHMPHDKAALGARRLDGDRIRGGTWLHEGQTLVDCRIEGAPRRTNVASYWLGGVAAAYQPWVGLVHKYLAGVLHYVRTGDETELRQSSHDDQAWPYLPLAARGRRSSDEYAARKETWTRGEVPVGVRFLTAAVDVQLRRFVVQVHGWGRDLESWLIDRFTIFTSERLDAEGRIAPLNPGAFIEDWEVLARMVVGRTYRVANTELDLSPLLTLCDSGGAEGVTAKAYEFWRKMRDRGLGQRFMLIKGTGTRDAPRTHETWPDARGRNDRSAGRGDVPVWQLNVNLLKDGISGDLNRPSRGPGFIHIPDWVDPEYFAELAAEVRTAKGWENPREQPNEAFDLHGYNRAACILLGAEAINWDAPPDWAVAPTERKPPEPPPPRARIGFLSTPRQRARGPR